MPMRPAGLNCVQGGSTENLTAYVARLRPALCVVIDEPKRAEALLKYGAVSYRRNADGDRDDAAHAHHDPIAFVHRRHAEAPRGCSLYLGNEPGNSRKTLADLDKWTLAAAKECTRLGRIADMWNFSTGQPETEDMPLLRASYAYAREYGHRVCFHEYWDIGVRKDFGWHVGRFAKLLERMDGRWPKVAITEAGCAVGFNPLIGWQGKQTETAYAAEIWRAAKVYAVYGIPFCIFSWGAWP